jgi:hypothetical protein
MTGPKERAERSSAALRKRRAALVRQLPPLTAILRGSLIDRYKRCGKPGCKCMEGRGHGPKVYLSVSMPGSRPVMRYVPADAQQQVRELLDNFRHARALLEEICEINLELLRRKERLG